MRECVWSPQHSVWCSAAILRPVDCFHPAWYSFLRLFIVRLVMCLLPYLPNETGGSARQDAYFLFPYDLHRKWQSMLCTGAHSKGSFLSILFFSIFQSSEILGIIYWSFSILQTSCHTDYLIKIFFFLKTPLSQWYYLYFTDEEMAQRSQETCPSFSGSGSCEPCSTCRESSSRAFVGIALQTASLVCFHLDKKGP